MTTPHEQMTAGYTPKVDHDTDRLQRIAVAHQTENDAEADRLGALGDTLPLSVRLSLGYHQSAREAAHELTTKENQA